MEFDDLLDDDLSTGNRYTIMPDASKGKRFGNYIIDRICMFVLAFMVGVGIVLIDPGSEGGWLLNSGAIGNYLFGSIIALGYYTLTEGLLGGKSIGKFITGTRTVRQDGGSVDFMDVLMRTLSRLVPFEAFSFLGSDDRGWHDEWTNTKVVDERAANNSSGIY